MHQLIFQQRPSRESQQGYQQVTQQVRDAVRRVVPPGRDVLVISQGDENLLHLEGRRAWHFPDTGDGVYAGYPVNDDQAITYLEELRPKGPYLVVPATALWWLDECAGFRRYLESHCAGLLGQESTCLIFDLHDQPTPEERRERRQLLDGIRALIQRHLAPHAALLVLSGGQKDLLDLGDRRAAHFPQALDGAYAG